MSNLIYTNFTKVFHPTTYLLVSICSAKKHLQLQFCLIKIAQYELTTISGWCNRKSYLLQVMVIPNPQHCQNFHLFVFFFWCEWLPNDKLFGFLSLTRAHKKKLFVTNKHVRPVNGIWKHWTQHVFQLTNENVISKKTKNNRQPSTLIKLIWCPCVWKLLPVKTWTSSLMINCFGFQLVYAL